MAPSEIWQRTGRLICLLLALALPTLPLCAQQVFTNRVLEVDGTGGYVELPPNIFNDLTEATVEMWVKWRSFPTNDPSRVFSYGEENS